ncbi:MAG: hypothetical protein EHM36_01685 [Deltaproteobacteria bacterium]|nr:MAG: hypothetical protein EHM36_01685 [Deltaproteobacteria bacterium]
MKKIAPLSILLSLCLLTIAFARDLKVEGKKLLSEKPPFAVALPSEFQLIHSSSAENREENSLTRAYLFIREKNKQVEEMLIVQIADKTNPQAGPMMIPSLKPLAEKKLFSKGKIDRKGLEIDYLIQVMAWNPEAPSLRPLAAKGLTVPSHWALQGQCLFSYYAEHAVFIRYSKDANSFGFKVSQEGKSWEKDSISGNEKTICEIFQKTFMTMIDSLRVQ